MKIYILIFSQSFLKNTLLLALENETDSSVQSSLCDIAGELAGYVLEPEEWSEILPFSYKYIQVSFKLNK